MKISFLIPICFLSAGATLAAPGPKDPDDLIRLRSIWEKTRQDAVHPLTAAYFQSLESLKMKLTQAGSLDAALAVDKEIKSFADTGKHGGKQASKSAPEEMTKLRDEWEKGRKEAVAPTDIRYTDALHGLKLKYTQAGDLDGAIAVEKEIKAVASASLPEGRISAPATPAGKAAAFDPAKEDISKFCGVKWLFGPDYITKSGPNERWMKLRTDGAVITGWKQHLGKWKLIAPSKVEVRPFLDEARTLTMEFDAKFETAGVEGDGKTSAAQRKKN